MPNLLESLEGRDQRHLQIIAGLWDVELPDQADQPAVASLAELILNRSKVDHMISALPGDAKTSLDDLRGHGGRLPWAQFTRTYGEVREMGAAKRDRERPFEHPVSPVETLWYRAFVAKAFFDTPSGPEEFAYVPDDLLALMTITPVVVKPGMGRPASASEYAQIIPANDQLLDHTCTLLAALRMGIDLPGSFPTSPGEVLTSTFVKALLEAGVLLDVSGTPLPEPTRLFLESGRGDALLKLFNTWKSASSINDLKQLPGLQFEGKWKNDPQAARRKLLEYLAKIPANTWWSLGSFISAVKQLDPDFQRPAGDYDSWFIRSKLSGEYLRGFGHWDAVDGRLVSFIITGPLHWLGVLDLASPGESQEVTAFRFSRWSKPLLNGKAPTGLPVEQESLVVRSDARISARRLVPRRVRYQVARFCEWEKETPDGYQYRITPASLKRARQQELTVTQLVTLISKNARAVPPSLLKALDRWEKQGSEARFEKMVVLRVVSAEILVELRKSRAGRFLGENIGPTTIAINPGAEDKVLGVLAELGYLGDVRIEEE